MFSITFFVFCVILFEISLSYVPFVDFLVSEILQLCLGFDLQIWGGEGIGGMKEERGKLEAVVIA